MMTRAAGATSRPNILLMNREHLPDEIAATRQEIAEARARIADLEETLATLTAIAAVMQVGDAAPKPEEPTP